MSEVSDERTEFLTTNKNNAENRAFMYKIIAVIWGAGGSFSLGTAVTSAVEGLDRSAGFSTSAALLSFVMSRFHFSIAEDCDRAASDYRRASLQPEMIDETIAQAADQKESKEVSEVESRPLAYLPPPPPPPVF